MKSCLGKKLGSPPPVRGLLASSSVSASMSRITPACAGTTLKFLIFVPIFRDHPRLCGDYQNVPIVIDFSRGSPPPVRGLLGSVSIIPALCRITPACAGTTCTFFCLHKFSKDHPRLCGDYAFILWIISRGIGSPPPVRGLLKADNLINDIAGITPACAGTTFTYSHSCLI